MTPTSMVYDTDSYSFNGVYKPTNIKSLLGWGYSEPYINYIIILGISTIHYQLEKDIIDMIVIFWGTSHHRRIKKSVVQLLQDLFAMRQAFCCLSREIQFKILPSCGESPLAIHGFRAPKTSHFRCLMIQLKMISGHTDPQN